MFGEGEKLCKDRDQTKKKKISSSGNMHALLKIKLAKGH
jgi:hypothetical protein